ncbi:MAG: sigma-70 family RNA polymerase sigma factor [Clostridia bacterium]|nr:sigma-70 family RNA polymerase sigma factor [Clostridia bacterium]
MNEQNVDIVRLISECRERSDVAFAELVRRYTPLIRKVISGFKLDCVDDDELFSEACVALHQAVMSYDVSQSDVTFGLYARVCIHRRMIDLQRRRRSRPDVLDLNEDVTEGGSSPEATLVARERFESIITNARSVLSDYEYSVLILHIQGYQTAAIAKQLSRTPKSVDNAKARLFRRLREAFDSENC